MSIYLITAINLVNGMSLRGSRVLLSLFAIKLGASAFEIGLLLVVAAEAQEGRAEAEPRTQLSNPSLVRRKGAVEAWG